MNEPGSSASDGQSIRQAISGGRRIFRIPGGAVPAWL
jgi:hypothetical protein